MKGDYRRCEYSDPLFWLALQHGFLELFQKLNFSTGDIQFQIAVRLDFVRGNPLGINLLHFDA